jgi:hypothetical protein
MKQIACEDELYVNRLKIKSIAHSRDDADIFFKLIRDDMDSLHEMIVVSGTLGGG